MSAPSLRLTVPDAAAMESLGASIAGRLRTGDLVLLDGALGAGKTTLTRGIGGALGVRGAVTSPTFVLARTHPTATSTPLVHVDAYRLSTAMELDDLDLDFENSITVVEWGAGKLDGTAESWLQVDIRRRSGADRGIASGIDEDLPEPRDVVITGHGTRWSDLAGLAE